MSDDIFQQFAEIWEQVSKPIHYAEVRPLPAQVDRVKRDFLAERRAARLRGPDRKLAPRTADETVMPTQVVLDVHSRPAAYAMAQPRNNWDRELPAGAYKPYGGLWTSTLDTCHTDGWLRWSLDENWNAPTAATPAWSLTPMPARVLRIETPDDIEWFHDQYGIPVSPHYRQHMDIDWESVRETWDAVHLPAPAYWQQHIRFGGYMTFYGWDCESTLWLRWRFWRATPISTSELIEKYHAAHADDD